MGVSDKKSTSGLRPTPQIVREIAVGIHSNGYDLYQHHINGRVEAHLNDAGLLLSSLLLSA
jgi:hypothetical protein